MFIFTLIDRAIKLLSIEQHNSCQYCAVIYLALVTIQRLSTILLNEGLPPLYNRCQNDNEVIIIYYPHYILKG